MDEQLLLLINGYHNEIMDQMMVILTYRFTWIPLYILMAYYAFRTMKMEALWFILSIAVAILITDQLCASVIRPCFERLRPSNLDNPLHVYIHVVDDYRGGSYGMPSCHAANSFALLTVWLSQYRQRWMVALAVLWVFVQCYSRMYLGVHYPTDILVGAIIGTCVALGVVKSHRLLKCKMHNS